MTAEMTNNREYVPINFQEEMEAEGWQTVGYEEFIGGIPRTAVMEKPRLPEAEKGQR